MKESLESYNAQDCEALQRLTEFSSSVVTGGPELKDRAHASFVDVHSLPRNSFFKFRKVQFQVPELEVINQTAYWNYQRDRILVRSSPRLKAIAQKGKSRARYQPKADQTVKCPTLAACTKCGGNILYKHRECSKTVLDVKFCAFGIKRSITKYLFDLYRCPNCGAMFRNHHCPWTKGKFGKDLPVRSRCTRTSDVGYHSKEWEPF